MRNFLILILLIIVAAVFTNPSVEKHEAAVIEEVKNFENMEGEIDGDGLKALGALLGDAIGLNTLERYANNNVQVKDLKVCSLTQLKIKGEYKTIGIGAFGNVWMLQDIKETVMEKLQ